MRDSGGMGNGMDSEKLRKEMEMIILQNMRSEKRKGKLRRKGMRG